MYISAWKMEIPVYGGNYFNQYYNCHFYQLFYLWVYKILSLNIIICIYLCLHNVQVLTTLVLNLIQNLSHPSLTLGLRDQFPSCCDHRQHHQHLLSNQIKSLSCHLLLKKGQRKLILLKKKNFKFKFRRRILCPFCLLLTNCHRQVVTS